MTDWMPLFREITRHREGYVGAMTYHEVVSADHHFPTWLPGLPSRLYMAPMPTGNAIGISDQVLNYQMEMKA